MKKIFYSLITTLVVTIFCSIPVLAVSTSEVLSSAQIQEILENNYSTDFNPPASRESSEYIDTFTGSLSLSENIINLPGKNGLDVNLSISYNSQEIGKSYSYDTTSYDTAANPTAFYYTYVNDSGSTKNILVVFENEYELLNTAPISFTAKELPNPSEDDNGDEYYKYSSFKTSYDDIVFTRNLDMAPFELYISASTKLTTTDIDIKDPEVGSIWTWNIPRVLSNIRPTKTETISGVEYYDLYTAFIDADGEYRQLWFTYEKEDGDITYKSMDALSTVKYTCWYDDPQGDTVDSVRGITYHCKIRDTQGRTMYFAKLGNLVAIEDRFGNIIKYTFENKRLSKIVDTLGRIISVEYVNKDAYVYVDYDGEGDAEPILYTKILYSAENDNTLDPNNYLISDDTYTSTIVRFEDNNTENRTVYTYKKWHALYSLSNIAYRYEYCVCNVITNITHPNSLSTSYTYEKAMTSAGCSKKDYFVVARCDFDNDLPFNAVTYDYTTKPSSSSSSYKTVKTRSADSFSETFSGASYLQTKTSVSDNVTLTETYEYTTSRGRRKVKLLTQQFKNGTTSGVAREISTPYTNFRPSGIAYDDYEKTITYHDDSNFIATETYNQSEDVLIKTAYTLSPEGDNFYTGRTIDSATVSQSTDGGDSYTEKYTVEYTYNPDGTPASCVVDPDGINQVTSYSYIYGTDGSITTTSVISNLKDADGNSVDNITTSSKIDYLGRLLWTEDGNGNKTYFEYDRLGRIIKQTNPDLTFRTYAYSTSDRTVIVTDENGVMEKALYNGFGNILSVYKNVGTVQSPVWVPVLEYEYDALCRPILSVTYTGYNEENTPNKWVETHYTYGAFDNVATIATYDEEGTELSCESYTYNFADRIGSTTSAIEPHDVTNGGTSRKFTSVTVESSPKDGITPPTVKQYLDRQSRLVKQVTTDGSDEYISTYIYDALGNVLEFKDESAYADYDVDYSQKFEYNYNNQVIKAYNAEGNYITNTYDILGRQLTSTDYMGNTQTYTYDSIGRVLTASAPVDDNVTSLTSYYYDSNSNITSQVASAAAGNITYTCTYDSLNRPVTAFNGSTYSVNQYEGSRIVKTASGLEGATSDISELLPTNTTYNVVGYVYNSLGYLASETTFNGTTSYTYDLAGNTLTVTDPKGITTTNTYDSRGNLITSTAQDDVIAYSYNAFNLVTEASRNGVATTYTYDNLARNITETTGTDTIARSYNTAGQVKTMSLTRSGVVLQSAEYEYNVSGNMTSASDGNDTVIYTYNENGFPINEEKAGIITSYTYTQGNLMKSTTNSRRRINDPTYEEGYNDIRPISSFEYSYYPDGNVHTVADTRGTTTYNTNYSYDSGNRLSSAAITNGDSLVHSWQYLYNNRGDRISQTVTDADNVATTTTYTYTNHRLTRETTGGNSTEYRYDANGNTIAKLNDSVTYQYTYTPRNEVATVITQSGTYSYTYNASSLRTSKTVDGVTTNFIWAGSNIIREETPDKATDYFYGINRVSRHVTGDAYTYTINETTYDDEGNRITTTIPVNGYHEFYAYDGRGNVVHTMAIDSIDLYLKPFFGSAAPFPEIDINADGLADLTDINMLSYTYPIVQNYYYSPFGEIWQGENPNDTNPFRYGGEYLDQETGDIYLRARYYDPSIGRFITVDPIKDGTNWYVYCNNNPIMFVDPWGLKYIPLRETAESDGYSVSWSDDTLAATVWEDDYTITATFTVGVGEEGHKPYIGEDGKLYVWDEDYYQSTMLSADEIKVGVTVTEIDGVWYKDFSVPINAALNNATAEAERKIFFKHAWFINQVNHKAPWDIKRESSWNQTIGENTYPGWGVQVYYNGALMTPEELGNYTYGYIGAALDSRGRTFFVNFS